MRRLGLGLAVAALVAFGQKGTADETPEALLLEAARVFAASPGDSRAIDEADKLLKRILANFPTSQIAVDLAYNRSPAGFDLADFTAAKIAASGGGGLATKQAATARDLSGEASGARLPRGAVARCLGEKLGGAPLSKIHLTFVLSGAGTISGLPELLRADEAGPATRSSYARALLAMDACAPFDPKLASLDLRTGQDGTIVVTEFEAGAPSQMGAPVPERMDILTLLEPPTPPDPGRAMLEEGTLAGERGLELDAQAYREIQARLEAVGFDPGGVDGRPGEGTRAAVRAWQAEQGTAPTGYFSRSQLAFLQRQSEDAFLEWRQDPENYLRLNPPSPIEIGPENIAGRWLFTTQCGASSKLGKREVTGVMHLRSKGAQDYIGTLVQSQGFRGSFAGTVRGRKVEGLVSWGLFLGSFTLTGQVDDQELVIRGSDSNRCSFFAQKG